MHVVVEQAPRREFPDAPDTSGRRYQVLPVSARNADRRRRLGAAPRRPPAGQPDRYGWPTWRTRCRWGARPSSTAGRWWPAAPPRRPPRSPATSRAPCSAGSTRYAAARWPSSSPESASSTPAWSASCTAASASSARRWTSAWRLLAPLLPWRRPAGPAHRRPQRRTRPGHPARPGYRHHRPARRPAGAHRGGPAGCCSPSSTRWPVPWPPGACSPGRCSATASASTWPPAWPACSPCRTRWPWWPSGRS